MSTPAQRLKHVIFGGGRRGAIVEKILARCIWVDRGYKDGYCLEWQGPDSGKPGRGRAKGRGHSYARMCLDGVTSAVHRVLWITLNGFLPSKKQLDHLCENRRCVLHCEPVTHLQNQRRKNRDKLLPRHSFVATDAAAAPPSDLAV
jgi:hypothetical protein